MIFLANAGVKPEMFNYNFQGMAVILVSTFIKNQKILIEKMMTSTILKKVCVHIWFLKIYMIFSKWVKLLAKEHSGKWLKHTKS